MNKWQRINYQPNLPLGEKGERVTACDAHKRLSMDAAKEGMVLLKNEEKVLPLTKGTKVALFGKGSIDYVKGGGGSGDVTVEYITNLYDGMSQLESHVSVFDPLSDFYTKHVQEEYSKGREPGLIVEPIVPSELVDLAKAYTDTAIVSISRFSGEGWDRKSSREQEGIHAEAWVEKYAYLSNELFEDGDFCLSQREEAMVATVKENFDKVVIVLNVGGVVDTNWFVEEEQIQSVLMAWQGGMEGGLGAAQLLCGIGNPSGKLADTFAKELSDYPSSYNYHDSKAYVDYTDDIYVGYRYFETVPGMNHKVNYPFGYGLSYSEFDRTYKGFKVDETSIAIYMNVTNVGDVAGREVIQAYAMPPQGQLGKPQKNLIAFKKTRLLEVGESQLLTLKFQISDMASYDDVGYISKSAYVLEKGDYKFFVGNSVRDGFVIEDSYSIDEDKVIKQLSEKLAPTGLAKRMTADGTYEILDVTEGNNPNQSVLNSRTPEEIDGFAPPSRQREHYRAGDINNVISLLEVVEGKESMEAFMAQLSDEDLANLLGGQENTGVANTFGFGHLPKYGVPNAMTADGPAGLRINKECGVNTTAWPCSTLLACTWDDELVYKVGEAGAKEVKENNLGIWLTPAVNIHRSPLCGRNFEYYSEDPFVTGKLAAAMVRGIQSVGVSSAVKHFALNNKETNRKDSDSRVSERAAREIYLKGFEIIVKESDPWCIMSSYNMINGHRASENKELLEDILREEWGFNGAVTTDWWTYGEHYKEVLAGNDIKMACGFPQRLLEAMELGAITRVDMEDSVKRILELLIKLD